jgi:hypothetical protein
MEENPMFTELRRAAVGLIVLLISLPGMAQPLQLALLSDDTLLIGLVSTAEGLPAAGASASVENLSHPDAPIVNLSTDAAGVLLFVGEHSGHYRIRVGSGPDQATAEITLSAPPPEPFTWPPIYITLGILMLLSLIPARLLRKNPTPPA